QTRRARNAPVDQAVAADDVAGEIRQQLLHVGVARVVELVLPRTGGAFVFQQFQEQRKLRHFNRLTIQIHAVKIVLQDAAALRQRQPPASVLGRYATGFLCLLLVPRLVVPVGVVAQQFVVHAKQE